MFLLISVFMAHKASLHDVHRTKKHLFEVLRRPRGGGQGRRNIAIKREQNKFICSPQHIRNSNCYRV